MSLPETAFRHHPELRDLITPPETSFFRDFDMGVVDEQLAERGLHNWRRPDADREANRRDTLAGRPDEDLWVFAYGSLMWDPALIFDEIRRAHSPAHARCMNLLDELGRGTPEAPGLQATLDQGGGCTGYALRIAKARVEDETTRLWQREMIAYGYVPRFIPLETAQGPVEALAFTANRASERVLVGIGFEEQAQMIARGEGVLGPCRDNLENLTLHLDRMGIKDRDLLALRAAVRAQVANTGA